MLVYHDGTEVRIGDQARQKLVDAARNSIQVS